MKILLTGVTGYIAQQLLPVLLEEGHTVVCCVRDRHRFNTKKFGSAPLEVIEADFLDPSSLVSIPSDIDVAYYLIHSMASSTGDFRSMEEKCALNFRARIEQTNTQQVIYLSGIVNEEKLSQHLASRKRVEDILAQGSYALTTLRAGIIVGAGSASFEIIRDIVEKLPVMIAPKWLSTKCQPIAIHNVTDFLSGVIGRKEVYDKSYDIGGPDILSYKQMLLHFATIRGLRRRIIPVAVMSPKLSSYWLYFVTATSFSLAQNLVNSMKIEVIAEPNDLAEMLGVTMLNYDESIKLAFGQIEQNQVLSSWRDAQSSGVLRKGLSQYVQVPTEGCYKDVRTLKVSDPDAILNRIWRIGGKSGWYYSNWLWKLRGFIDQLFGGVGMRRGRNNDSDIAPGEALDFWRVLLASRLEKRLLLYAEMKLPGEAWLEFKLDENDVLTQTATFRPLGVLGRLYWYAVYPLHGMIFKGMILSIGKSSGRSR